MAVRGHLAGNSVVRRIRRVAVAEKKPEHARGRPGQLLRNKRITNRACVTRRHHQSGRLGDASPSFFFFSLTPSFLYFLSILFFTIL